MANVNRAAEAIMSCSHDPKGFSTDRLQVAQPNPVYGDSRQDAQVFAPTIPLPDERSERAVLLEQLRHWQNLQKQAGNVVSQINRRLAEIERASTLSDKAA